MSCRTAFAPSTVPGTLIITLGRPTVFHSRRASAIVAADVVGRGRRDLDGDVPVPALGVAVDAGERVAGVAHVGRGDEFEQLPRGQLAFGLRI